MSVNEPWGETPVPELYGRGRATWPSLYRVADGEEVLAGITAHLGAADLAPRTGRRGLGAADWAPRHTPGHLIYGLNLCSHRQRVGRNLYRRCR